MKALAICGGTAIGLCGGISAQPLETRIYIQDKEPTLSEQPDLVVYVQNLADTYKLTRVRITWPTRDGSGNDVLAPQTAEADLWALVAARMLKELGFPITHENGSEPTMPLYVPMRYGCGDQENSLWAQLCAVAGGEPDRPPPLVLAAFVDSDGHFAVFVKPGISQDKAQQPVLLGSHQGLRNKAVLPVMVEQSALTTSFRRNILGEVEGELSQIAALGAEGAVFQIGDQFVVRHNLRDTDVMVSLDDVDIPAEYLRIAGAVPDKRSLLCLAVMSPSKWRAEGLHFDPEVLLDVWGKPSSTKSPSVQLEVDGNE